MHWNMPSDSLPGSATLVRVFWTAGLTTVAGLRDMDIHEAVML